jgi:hypothetical protein
MFEKNPYESPKTDIPETNRPTATIGTAKIVFEALLLLGLGVGFGVFLGVFACFHLSNGNAAGHFYLTYGSVGAIAGALGSIIGGVFIGLVRLEAGITSRRPTTATRRVAGGDQPTADE